MPFIPHTEEEIQDMLAEIKVASINDLFDEVPEQLKIDEIAELEVGKTELEISRILKARAIKDAYKLNFIGAGSYEHFIPAAVWEIASRGEFLTAYTPYQAEASQGTLQLLYEYQTMMASLMGQDVSNASLYDGATALAEAVLMAIRCNKKVRSKKVLIPKTVHPLYVDVVKSIVSTQNIEIIELDFNTSLGKIELEQLANISDEISALVIPCPNFFGVIEDIDGITDWAHKKNVLVIAVVNPLAMSIIKPPGDWGREGADFSCGEGQPLGVPMASGGPYFGFLCCKKEFIRQLPGRIVGLTKDTEGKDGFTLTLQAREQHIRRSKATSNICTNQGLLVTAATIYMSLLGPNGLADVAIASHDNLNLLIEKINSELPKVKILFQGNYFHEVVLQFDKDVIQIQNDMADLGIQCGFNISTYYPKLKNSLLICVTETKQKQDLDFFVDSLKRVL